MGPGRGTGPYFVELGAGAERSGQVLALYCKPTRLHLHGVLVPAVMSLQSPSGARPYPWRFPHGQFSFCLAQHGLRVQPWGQLGPVTPAHGTGLLQFLATSKGECESLSPLGQSEVLYLCSGI